MIRKNWRVTNRKILTTWYFTNSQTRPAILESIDWTEGLIFIRYMQIYVLLKYNIRTKMGLGVMVKLKIIFWLTYFSVARKPPQTTNFSGICTRKAICFVKFLSKVHWCQLYQVPLLRQAYYISVLTIRGSL